MTQLGDVVVILASAYAIFVAMVVAAVRRPVPRPGSGPWGVGGVAFRDFVSLAAGGYVAFLAIVLVFHVLLVGQRGALRSAALGGAILLAIAVPVFGSLSWLEAAWSRRHRAG